MRSRCVNLLLLCLCNKKLILDMDRNVLTFYMKSFSKHALAAHVGYPKPVCGNGATLLLAKPLYV